MPGIETSTGGVLYGTGDYYNYVLNDLFLPAIADTVIYPNAFLKRIPRGSRRVEGKLVKFPIHYDDANGVSALGADGALPEADTEKFAQYAFGIRHIYVRAKFDGISADASKSRLASWLDIVETEMKAKSTILARQRQRMYRNDGTGRLCAVSSYAANVYTCKIPADLPGAATCASSPTRFIKVGMLFAIVSSTGATQTSGTIRAIGKVASKTPTTFTAQTGASDGYDHVVTATPPSNNDYVVTLGSFNGTGSTVSNALKDTGFRNEPMGTAGILADADPADGTSGGFQGIDSDAAANNWHRATVKSGSGTARPLTLELIDELFLAIVENGDVVPTIGWCDFTQLRKYAQLLLPDRRFNTGGGTMDMDGGYGKLTYNGMPFMADRDCYGNRIEFVYEPDLYMYEMSPVQWMNKDGSIYHRVTDKDAYQATLYVRETMGSDVRDHHGLLIDLNS